MKGSLIRPENPIEYIANYLLENDPKKLENNNKINKNDNKKEDVKENEE